MHWIEYHEKRQGFVIMNIRRGRVVDYIFDTYKEALEYCLKNDIPVTS